jgi:hypothetical protein
MPSSSDVGYEPITSTSEMLESQRELDATPVERPIEDTSQPRVAIPTIPAIDWDHQPSVPAEKIDWSKQGEPLRVRPTFGVMLTAVAMMVSVLGAGAYFYWGVWTHVDNEQIHLPKDGVPWGVKGAYETRAEAQGARKALHKEIVRTVNVAHDKLRNDLVREIRKRPRARR